MSLTSGTRLGPYEIVAPLGAGGMGEVYRAKDTKLNRDVAIKVLPESFALDADRVARFTREAQVLASLNHPNIAQIYGIEEQGSTRALVMELVEGEDLSAHISRGAIALPDALPIAKQIADALEAAHEQGIVHRDLKPQNIKVRADGTVKVLDFGLARTLDTGLGTRDSHNSPTMTTPAMTAAGMIMGTAAYMSPEQARGRAVDRRADIWAFGCVLYEMLAGRPAFHRETVTDTLSAILRDDPEWAPLANVPPRIDQLLRRCLEKDAKQRLRDIGEARILLSDTASGAVPAASATAAGARMSASPRRHSFATTAIAAVVMTAIAA
ncbi:MAG: serine/threonine-protein kinase, partial [Acidobacteriota bacterium]